jgi:hypothetical protein
VKKMADFIVHSGKGTLGILGVNFLALEKGKINFGARTLTFPWAVIPMRHKTMYDNVEYREELFTQGANRTGEDRAGHMNESSTDSADGNAQTNQVNVETGGQQPVSSNRPLKMGVRSHEINFMQTIASPPLLMTGRDTKVPPDIIRGPKVDLDQIPPAVQKCVDTQ